MSTEKGQSNPKSTTEMGSTAAYIAGAIERIAKELDEREIAEMLEEAERLIAGAKRETEKSAGDSAQFCCE